MASGLVEQAVSTNADTAIVVTSLVVRNFLLVVVNIFLNKPAVTFLKGDVRWYQKILLAE